MRQPPISKWLLPGALALLVGCGADSGEGSLSDLPDASVDVGADTGTGEPDRWADVSPQPDAVTDADVSVDLFVDGGEAEGVSTLLIVNAIAAGPIFQVSVNGGPASATLAFAHATEPIPLGSGTHRIAIQSVGDSGQPVILWEDDVTVPAEAAISAVVTWDDGPDSGVRLVFSGAGPAPPPDQAHLRIVHAMADAPNLTVDLWDDGLVDARLTSFGVAPGEPLRLPASEPLLVRVRRDDATQGAVLRVTLDPLSAGATTTLVLTGRCERLATDSDGPAALLIDEGGDVTLVRADPRVALLNASPNAPALDVFEGQSELTHDAAFGELSPGFDVSRLNESLALFPSDWGLSSLDPPSGRDEPLAEWSTAALEPGRQYLLVATGLLGAESDDEALQVVAIQDDFARMGATPLARLVHAAPRSPVLDLRMTGPFAWLDLLSEPLLTFGDSTAPPGLPLPVGPLGLLLGDTNVEDPADTFFIDVVAGDRLVLVVVNERGAAQRLGQTSLLGLVAVDMASAPWRAMNIAAER